MKNATVLSKENNFKKSIGNSNPDIYFETDSIEGVPESVDHELSESNDEELSGSDYRDTGITFSINNAYEKPVGTEIPAETTVDGSTSPCFPWRVFGWQVDLGAVHMIHNITFIFVDFLLPPKPGR